MSLDERLTAALLDVAQSHEPSAPDLPGLVRGGRRRRRTRGARRATAAGVVSAAVVAGASYVLGTLGPQEPPRPAAPVNHAVTDLPLGSAPTIPHCAGRQTVVDSGSAIHVPCDVLVHRGDATLLLTAGGAELIRDGELLPLGHRMWTYWFPGMSHDGGYAAWVAKAPGTETGAELLVYDLTTGEQAAGVPWPTTEGWVPGIDDRGRVYFEEFAGGVSYFDLHSGVTGPVRGAPPRRTTAGARVAFVTADGFGVVTAAASRLAVVGEVTADGRFTRRHTVDQGMSRYSPDGERFVHDTDDGLAVSSTDGGTAAVLLDLPVPGGPTWYPVWETDDSLLLQFDPESTGESLEWSLGFDAPARRTYLLRCDAGTGDCEVALEPGWGDRLREPAYR